MAKADEGERKDQEKKKVLESTLAQIEKQYGKGAIMRLGDQGGQVEVEVIPTGSLALDAALGTGGFPRGRIVEIYGPEGAGKTLVSLHVIREAQKLGGNAAFIDAEHALDTNFARRIGVDVQNLIVSQPDSGEQGMEIVDTLVRSGAFDVIVVDSVAALVPQAELEGEMGDSHMGLHARLMSQALRKLTGSINRSRTCLVFLNQLRMKIGVMFGNPETTTGGRALCFYASVRLDIRSVGLIKDGEEVIGRRTRIKVVKNKVAPPFREAEFDIMFRGDDIGVSREGDLLDLGIEHELIEKSGTWFSYAKERLGQGRENARVFLKEHPELADQIEGELRELLQVSRGTGGPNGAALPEEESEVELAEV